jgi:hypothetical protein
MFLRLQYPCQLFSSMYYEVIMLRGSLGGDKTGLCRSGQGTQPGRCVGMIPFRVRRALVSEVGIERGEAGAAMIQLVYGGV